MDRDRPPFIPGLKLCEYFFEEAVRPVLDDCFPGLAYSAGRLDYGSDVLGFDTPLSRDHGWGPKVTLFLLQKDCIQLKEQIPEVLSRKLPGEIRGYPTNFDFPFSGEGSMVPAETGRINHWVGVTTIPDFFEAYLGINPTESISVVDWLTIPQNHLRTVASGVVFHDGLDQLGKIQQRLGWYPKDIWLYLLANQWRRIDQEEPFMARCEDVGDEVGSRIVASRQVNEIMRLCFLMKRQYAPYYKWFGTAFSLLDCAQEFNPIFKRIFDSQNWLEREAYLSAAYQVVMQIQNALGLTPIIEPTISRFYNRPYKVPGSDRFVQALHKAIQSKEVRELPKYMGGVDQSVDSTDILSNPHDSKKFSAFYK
jgi:hypothetical protein